MVNNPEVISNYISSVNLLADLYILSEIDPKPLFQALIRGTNNNLFIDIERVRYHAYLFNNNLMIEPTDMNMLVDMFIDDTLDSIFKTPNGKKLLELIGNGKLTPSFRTDFLNSINSHPASSLEIIQAQRSMGEYMRNKFLPLDKSNPIKLKLARLLQNNGWCMDDGSCKAKLLIYFSGSE